MGAFSSSLYSDSAFGASLDYSNPTIAPQLISSGSQPRMSPYLQSTVDLYDPNAPWPNSAALSSSDQLQSQQQLPHPQSTSGSKSNTLYSSPAGSSFNLADSSDPLSLSSTVSGSLSKSSGNSLTSSTLDFRGSLRQVADPNCITATEQGRRYLYVSVSPPVMCCISPIIATIIFRNSFCLYVN